MYYIHIIYLLLHLFCLYFLIRGIIDIVDIEYAPMGCLNKAQQHF